jgi:Flp pilus assembly protein TadD
MLTVRGIKIVAICAALALSGCQASSFDGLDTADLTSPAVNPAARDIDTGKRQFRQANYGLAEKHFRKAVEIHAASPEAWMGLAASYDQLGRFDFADRAYEQLLKLAGRRPEIVNNIGYSHYLRGDQQKARELLMEARAGMADSTVVNANIALLN